MEQHRPRGAELSSLELAARVAALETTNAHLARRIAELSFLSSAAARLCTTLDRFEIARIVLDCASVAAEEKTIRAFIVLRVGKGLSFLAGVSIDAVKAEAAIAAHQDALERCVRLGEIAPFDGWAAVPIPGDVHEPALGAIAIDCANGKLSSAVRRRLQKLAELAGRSFANARVLAHSIAAGTIDELTGVTNRRHFDRRLSEELRRARRLGDPMSLILLDLDHFKDVNDAFGHQEGDRTLRSVAHCISNCVRDIDVVSRWGGEEFAVVLPGAEPAEAVRIAERIRVAVRALGLRSASGARVPTAVSCGVAWVDERIHTPAQCVAAADRCLLEAKRSGRDRTVDMHGAVDGDDQGRAEGLPERGACEHRGAARQP